MRAGTVAAVLACVVLAACTAPRDDDATPSSTPPSTEGTTPDGATRPGTQAADPLDLVNLWRVSGAEGEATDTWLRLDAGSYQLWRDCGFIEGGWAASGTMLLASAPRGFSAECPPDPWLTVPWLEAAVAYEAAGDGWLLRDAEGAVLATLTIDGAPETIPTAVDSYAQPPEVTDEVRARFAEPASLPHGLTPVTTDALVGRWVPEGGAPNDPFVEFRANRTWTGSDGCNAAVGSWAVDVGGRLLATSDMITAIGCDGAAVPAWVADSARAGLDGDALVLLDRNGAVLGRLVQG